MMVTVGCIGTDPVDVTRSQVVELEMRHAVMDGGPITMQYNHAYRHTTLVRSVRAELYVNDGPPIIDAWVKNTVIKASADGREMLRTPLAHALRAAPFDGGPTFGYIRMSGHAYIVAAIECLDKTVAMALTLALRRHDMRRGDSPEIYLFFGGIAVSG